MSDFESKVLEGMGELKADVRNLKEWTGRQDTQLQNLQQQVNGIPKAVNGTRRTVGIGAGTGALGAFAVIVAELMATKLGGR